MTINSCKISGCQVLPSLTLNWLLVQSTPKGFTLLLGTRLKTIQWDGPRRDVCLRALDFILHFSDDLGEQKGCLHHNNTMPNKSTLTLMNKQHKSI